MFTGVVALMILEKNEQKRINNKFMFLKMVKGRSNPLPPTEDHFLIDNDGNNLIDNDGNFLIEDN